MPGYSGCLKCGRVNVPDDHVCDKPDEPIVVVIDTKEKQPEPKIRRKVASEIDRWADLFNRQ